MLKSERAIGNYFELPKNSLRISPQDRESMVSLIQELHRVKGYAEDTFYLAVSIADRYLTVLATKGQKAPNLIQLATISILLAGRPRQSMPNTPIFLCSRASAPLETTLSCRRTR